MLSKSTPSPKAMVLLMLFALLRSITLSSLTSPIPFPARFLSSRRVNGSLSRSARRVTSLSRSPRFVWLDEEPMAESRMSWVTYRTSSSSAASSRTRR